MLNMSATERPIDKLKGQLKNLLEKAEPDYGKILALSAELASHDPEFVRFSVDSALISRLGEELVARQETAVSELVKNAYDADAQQVKLVFVDAFKPGGELIITDDGSGMTREQLINGFMRLASAEKLQEPKSPRYKRRRAGRKGIGRFAAQRLGTSLCLTTQTEASLEAMSITIDWSKFSQQQDLTSIPSRIQLVPKEREEGTTLRIMGLREEWSDAEIARVFRYITDLIQPFPISKRKKGTGKKEADPGFSASFCRRVGGKDIEIASEDRMVFDYALAEVTGIVDLCGYGEWHLKSGRYGLNEKHSIGPDKENPKTPYSHLTNVHFRAYYFIWESDLIPGQQFSRLRNLASQQGGIRLYRNGFRVLPYGESRNDWLGLDEEYRRRSILPPIANMNWFGFVQLIDADGDQFEETSSREGLTNKPSYKELVAFTGSTLIAAALRIASVRQKKLTAGQKGFKSQNIRSSGSILEQAAKELEETAGKLERVKVPGDEGVITASAIAVRGAVEGVRKAKEALVEENAMLRVLASLGLTIGIFTHEIRHQLFNLKTLVREWLEKYGSEKAMKAVMPVLENKVGVLQSYSAYFDVAVSANVRRELKPQDLSKHLFTFIDQFRPLVERENCSFADEEIEEELTTLPMHYSEWASILGNLLTNSMKAIRRGPHHGNGRIKIRAWKEDKMVIIDFSDNGDGIPPRFKERIFEPFFTTTNTAAESEDELTGTGLGLKIVRDIVSAYQGEIYIVKPPKGYATCFRIEIPEAPIEL